MHTGPFIEDFLSEGEFTAHHTVLRGGSDLVGYSSSRGSAVGIDSFHYQASTAVNMLRRWVLTGRDQAM